ncbi:unnamed protein product [Urochloa humidicola]
MLLQKSVQVPQLLGSTPFLVASIVNRHDRRSRATAFSLLGRSWAPARGRRWRQREIHWKGYENQKGNLQSSRCFYS